MNIFEVIGLAYVVFAVTAFTAEWIVGLFVAIRDLRRRAFRGELEEAKDIAEGGQIRELKRMNRIAEEEAGR